MNTRINSVNELRNEIAKGHNNYFIALNFGARSSKFITTDDYERNFEIINEIDGSEQTLTEEELFDEKKTLIGKAIKYGALYMETY